MQRAPALLPLRKKSAILFGLGSFGSPVALYSARAELSKLTMQGAIVHWNWELFFGICGGRSQHGFELNKAHVCKQPMC